MIEMFGKLGMGWLPDYPDFRDYTVEQASVKAMLATSRCRKTAKGRLACFCRFKGMVPSDRKSGFAWFLHRQCGRCDGGVFREEGIWKTCRGIETLPL